MTDFQQQALHLASRQDSPQWLASLRFEGAEQWLQAPWPTRRTELWKYTPLLSLQRQSYERWGKPSLSSAASLPLLELDAERVVFVNGVFSSELSSLPSGAKPTAVRFSEADAQQQAIIEKYLGKVASTERHLFASLSNAWLEDGLLLHVPRGQRMAGPLYIVHISTAESEPVTVNQRLLVVVEENAHAEFIEHFVSDEGSQNSFVNALTEIHIDANASVQHYRINLEQEEQIHIGGVHVDLWRDARYSGFTVAEGSVLKRIDYQINHRGQGADARLNGVYLPRNNQLIDYHTNVEHAVPHCTTS